MADLKVKKIIIGIDVGVHTGVSIYNRKTESLILVSSMKIHEAIKLVSKQFAAHGAEVYIRVEDARKRQWFGNSGREKLQGAGSVKRDSGIWEDFLNDLGVDFEMVAPKNNRTKMSAEYFKKYTGYLLRTNEHGRDAAMLVYQF